MVLDFRIKVYQLLVRFTKQRGNLIIFYEMQMQRKRSYEITTWQLIVYARYLLH